MYTRRCDKVFTQHNARRDREELVSLLDCTVSPLLIRLHVLLDSTLKLYSDCMSLTFISLSYRGVNPVGRLSQGPALICEFLYIGLYSPFTHL